MVRTQTDQIVFLRVRVIVEKGLGHLFITSSSSHFFNKTDFPQYLFKYCINSNASFFVVLRKASSPQFERGNSFFGTH